MIFDFSPQIDENPFCDLTAEDWEEIFGSDDSVVDNSEDVK